MPLPLSVARPRTLAVAPPVAAAGALAIGAALVWLNEQLRKANARDAYWWNTRHGQDALYRRPDYASMTSAQIQRSLQLLDHVGEDAWLVQPGGVLLERRELNREMLRRSGGGGFLFVAPGGMDEDLAGGLVAIGAAGLGTAELIWNTGVAAGRGLRRLADQLWGLLNRPSGYAPVPWPEAVQQQELTWQTPGTLQWGYYRNHNVTLSWADTNDFIWNDSMAGYGTAQTIQNCTGYRVLPYVEIDATYPPQYVTHLPATWVQFQINGVWQPLQVTDSAPSKYQDAPFRPLKAQGFVQAYPTTLTLNEQPLPPALAPAQTPWPGRAPFVTVPAAAPAALPAYTPPATEPQAVPGSEPVTQPAPAPGVTPARVPALTPIAAPSLPRVPAIPGATPTTGAGTVPAPSSSPTPATPEGSVLPWPGANPIDPVPLAPPATMDGIARKTGELEGKLDQIGRMLQPPVNGPDYGDLLGLVPTLLNWLMSADPAGGYEISSPCEQGPGGPADPLVASWSASIGPDAQILKRLDALAELLQHHKNLKQPSCKNPSPVGEVVTVQFEET